jgi:hypothetical protein
MILREFIIICIKFNNAENFESEVLVNLHIENETITVEVKKPVCKSAYGMLENLDKTIQWIRGHQDSLEYYLKNFEESCFGPCHLADTNALRLAILTHTSEAVVDFYVSEDNLLNLSATSKIITENFR